MTVDHLAVANYRRWRSMDLRLKLMRKAPLTLFVSLVTPVVQSLVFQQPR